MTSGTEGISSFRGAGVAAAPVPAPAPLSS